MLKESLLTLKEGTGCVIDQSNGSRIMELSFTLLYVLWLNRILPFTELRSLIEVGTLSLLVVIWGGRLVHIESVTDEFLPSIYRLLLNDFDVVVDKNKFGADSIIDGELIT